MIRHVFALLAAVAGLSGWAPRPQNPAESIEVRAVRFYLAEHDRTHVKGLVQIPLATLGRRDAAPMSYKVNVRVSDSSGLRLVEESWNSRVQPPASAVSAAEAYAMEMIEFAVAPGRYKLEVSVTDSVSGKGATVAREIRALTRDDPASDLLLSPDIRPIGSTDTVPRPGQFRAGQNLVTAVADLRLTPLRSRVFYLLEAYSDSGTAGTMAVSVRDSAGKVMAQTPATPVTVAPGGSLLKGQLDLAGLPEGSYRMSAVLELGGKRIERLAPVTMAGLDETLARTPVQPEANRVSDEGYFAGMSAEELDRAEAPLVHIAKSRELSAWDDKLSPGAKRRFLTSFWSKRDPTPGTPQNEARERFYEGIAFAERNYREGGRAHVPGWKTDRGRIYLRHGTPDDVLRRQQEGRAPPYEVWSYTRNRPLYYIFADRTGFGTFALIHSNDLNEPGLPGWGDILGRPAVSDAGRFLGVDLLESGRAY